MSCIKDEEVLKLVKNGYPKYNHLKMCANQEIAMTSTCNINNETNWHQEHHYRFEPHVNFLVPKTQTGNPECDCIVNLGYTPDHKRCDS